jgi:hypothetical protein
LALSVPLSRFTPRVGGGSAFYVDRPNCRYIMIKSTKGKWILGIIGTILLGAVGSGLWDVALKYVFSEIGRGILTGLSLGFGAIRDSCYLEIAKGQTDRASLWLVSFTLMPLFVGLGFLVGYTRSRPKPKTELADAQKLQFDVSYAKQRLAELEGELSTFKRKAGMWENFVVLNVIFFLSICTFRFITLSYISSAVTNYEQSYTICLPFLSDAEGSSIRSEYAQIHNKEDYVHVLQKLEAVAASHNISLPSFKPL